MHAMFYVPDLEMTHIHQLYSSFNVKNVITRLHLGVIEAGHGSVCWGTTSQLQIYYI